MTPVSLATNTEEPLLALAGATDDVSIYMTREFISDWS
jgi:hypothetical protein